MNIPALQQRLIDQHLALAEYVLSLSDEEYTLEKPEKWTAGQHVFHVMMIADLTSMALKDKRYQCPCDPAEHTRTYEELVQFYFDTTEGKKMEVPPHYEPEFVPIEGRRMQIKMLMGVIENLADILGGFSEEELDATGVVHPALGVISLREMGYFTIYHALHHHRLIQEHLA